MSTSLYYYFDLFGVAVFAVSGTLAATRKGMDIVGAVIIAAFTAIGGGTLRDLLLDLHPIFWMADPVPLYVIIVTAMLTILYLRFLPSPGNSLQWADAAGLALFTLSGTQIGENVGLYPVIAVLMGTITGVAGGVMRDVLSGEIPFILKKDLYATAAIMGATSYFGFKLLGLHDSLAFCGGMAIVFTIRILAIVYHVSLPILQLPKHHK
jgi:uncharacterized membrane protein YeiH